MHLLVYYLNKLQIERLIQNRRINIWLYLQKTKFCALLAQKMSLNKEQYMFLCNEQNFPNLAKLGASKRRKKDPRLLKHLHLRC